MYIVPGMISCELSNNHSTVASKGQVAMYLGGEMSQLNSFHILMGGTHFIKWGGAIQR